jgi:site-specific DNA-methyltransferase (adenine-specific)
MVINYTQTEEKTECSCGSIKNTDRAAQPVLNNLDCIIRNEDCFKYMSSLGDGSVDLVLTDPPYTISRKTGFSSVGPKGVERFAVSMEFGEWDKTQIEIDRMVAEFYRLLRKGGTAIIWYDLWKLSQLADAMRKVGFKQIRLIIWEKTNPVPLNSKINYLTNSREIAVLGVKDSKPTFHGEYDNGVYYAAIPNNGARYHPTQKPLDIFTELIQKHSNKGNVVLDCFLGSGTTAIAALSEGRRFEGCEIDESYFNIACRRVLDDRDKKGVVS